MTLTTEDVSEIRKLTNHKNQIKRDKEDREIQQYVDQIIPEILLTLHEKMKAAAKKGKTNVKIWKLPFFGWSRKRWLITDNKFELGAKLGVKICMGESILDGRTRNIYAVW
jgi:hypothetical protein